MRKFLIVGVILVLAVLLAGYAEFNQPFAGASSHREAPLISQDPVADATDFYMFLSPDKPDTVTLIANYVPFEYPGGGPNFNSFGDDVLYRINIDSNADAKADITYDFIFKTTVKNGNTFLYNTGPVTSLNDATLNIVQTYTLSRTDSSGTHTLGSNLPVAPARVGNKSMPDYEAVAKGAIQNLNGTMVFAGPRDDPFFVDLGSTFDLLSIRPGPPGDKGGGYDDLAGFNVHSIALQIPVSQLTAPPRTGIGGWTTAYRHATRVLDGKGGLTNSGDWVQVSRLGHPLVNEVVVPLAAKDLWNASKPADDKQFLAGVTDPEPARLLKAIYGISVPPTPRNDLVAIFLTGIPDLNARTDVVPSETLVLNTAIPMKSPGSRCGLLGGDTGGYPNGRRLTDDVVDIALRAVAGGTPFTPEQNIAPNNLLGDGVDQNDVPFQATFPYLAAPHSGSEFLNRVDKGASVAC